MKSKILLFLTTLFFVTNLWAQIPTNGLVAYYPFNGNANDESGNGWNGAVNGPTPTADRFGNINSAYNFNGVSDYIYVTNSNIVTGNQFCLSAWSKFNSQGMIICTGNQNDFLLEQVTNDSIHNFIHTDSPTGYYYNYGKMLYANLNQWNHICITYNGIELRTYINGLLVRIVNADGNLYSWQNDYLAIGTYMLNGSPSNSYFNGQIDDIAIYNRCLAYSEVQQLYGSTTQQLTLIYPKINLQSNTIQAGQTQQITGQSFNPFGKVYLQFYGATGMFRDSVVADINGNIAYTYNSPSNLSAGIAAVKATDKITGNHAPIKTFQITNSASSPIKVLTVTSPVTGQTSTTGQAINIHWTDKMFKQFGAYNYPVIPNTAKRYYDYTLEYQDNGGSWQFVKNVTGQAYLYSNVSFTETYAFSAPCTNCLVRVKDNLGAMLIDSSGIFNVTAPVGNIKGEFLWDYSYSPQPAIAPEGVTADGAGRFYIKVSKINSGTGAAIDYVSVDINDGVNTTPETLGKVAKATVISNFSNEGNNASFFSTTNSTPISNAYYFWYVAPDDFVGDNASDVSAKNRIVNAQITVHYTDGTSEFIVKPIKIVRPPLMLVHGLMGSSDTWKDFRGSDNLLLSQKNLFIVPPKAIELYAASEYDANAKALFGWNAVHPSYSFEGVIKEMRNAGYACNRLDYVAHSMGGTVLRYAAENYPTFYESSLKTYSKGFVNKFISLNTPHNSSPLADLVATIPTVLNNHYSIGGCTLTDLLGLRIDFGKDYIENPYAYAYLKPTNPHQICTQGLTNYVTAFVQEFDPSYQSGQPIMVYDFVLTGAFRDLSVVGGINLGATSNIKSHLIAGDIYAGYQNLPDFDELLPIDVANLLEGTETYLAYVEKIAKYVKAWKKDNPQIQAEIDNLLRISNTTERELKLASKLISYISNGYEGTQFLIDSDVIVPFMSQTAGLTANDPNVSVFDPIIHTDLGVGSSLSVTSNQGVCDKVVELLNTPIISTKFGNIPANMSGNRTMQTESFSDSLNTNALMSVVDSNIVVIMNAENPIYYVDSTVSISVHIKDTANLYYLALYFQGELYRTFLKNEFITFNVPVSGSILDSQFIYVEAYYDYLDSVVVVYDGLKIKVLPQGNPTNFQVNPEIIYLAENQITLPQYQVTYSNTVSNLGMNMNIGATVNNPTIMQFNNNTKTFTAVGIGETYAIVSYKGVADTVYFIVSDTTTFSTTGIFEPQNGNLLTQNIQLKAFPNPTENVINVDYILPQYSNIEISVMNMLGQTVKKYNAENQIEGQHNRQISIQEIPSGMYILNVKTDYGNFTTKIVKN